MRYRSGHKEATRQRILEIATRRFRSGGISAVGVVPIMKEAGLTHGGFYAHYTSKDELVADAVHAAFAQTNARLAEAVAQAPTGAGLEALLDTYLTVAHRDQADTGCVAAALSGELARMQSAARSAFDQGIADLAGLIEGLLPRDLADKRGRSLAITSLIVGALSLSRSVVDADTSIQLLAAARRNAIDLARQPKVNA